MDRWYNLEADEVIAQLQTDGEQGLSEEEATRRLAEYGPNELEERGRESPLAILARQFTEVMVMVLIAAAAISFLVGDPKDTAAILVIVVLNAALGFAQEYRAEKAMAALKKLAVPVVKVRRDDQVREIPATQLVPGDIVLLEAGARVPADGRLLEAINLRIDESPLTGESVPVEKTSQALAGELPVAEQRNMAFMGTTVTYGRGTMVTVATGMHTQLGHIAEMLQTVEREITPLQRRMAQLGKGLALAALALVGLTFALGVLRGEEPKMMFLTAISLAVAAVPEGLPAVVTIALALGAQRMVRRKALIRKLPAVETLGSVTTICSDKTGTLTENRMTVTVLDVAGRTVDLEEKLHNALPTLSPDDPPLAPADPTLALLVAGGSLCNDATLEELSDGSGRFRAVGDPTEGALVVAAARLGLWKEELERRYPRVAEVPFTSERKRMTTVHQIPMTNDQIPNPNWSLDIGHWSFLAFTKGAVDSLLEVSDRVWVNGRVETMDDHWRGRIERANDKLAGEGMRVLGVAFRPLEALPTNASEEELERELIFVGLVGMIDPPRPEVKEAVATCRGAGIRPVMITGDHPLTALHIARQLGIAEGPQCVVTGQELTRMSVEELGAIVEEVAVYARVSPEHKLKVVEALQSRGHIVAMTGDGVNDAPALKKADIGVAMGITGTDVSKEAADMVLLDDNFATIVAAVEEGRAIYDNIRKFIHYMLGTNSGEIFTMLGAILRRLPLPVLPLQILWINLLTDGLPAIALGFEPAEEGVMKRKPRDPRESVFARGLGRRIIWVGLFIALGTLVVFRWALPRPSAQTMSFVTLALFQMFNVLAVRSEERSFLSQSPLSNPLLLGAVILTFLAQLAVTYTPFLQIIFKTTPLSLAELAICIGVASTVFFAVELEKAFLRRRSI